MAGRKSASCHRRLIRHTHTVYKNPAPRSGVPVARICYGWRARADLDVDTGRGDDVVELTVLAGLDEAGKVLDVGNHTVTVLVVEHRHHATAGRFHVQAVNGRSAGTAEASDVRQRMDRAIDTDDLDGLVGRSRIVIHVVCLL